jgi:hypothetical protein
MYRKENHTKFFQLCVEKKNLFVSNLEVDHGAYPTDEDHYTSFSVVNKLSDPIKNKGCMAFLCYASRCICNLYGFCTITQQMWVLISTQLNN